MALAQSALLILAWLSIVQTGSLVELNTSTSDNQRIATTAESASTVSVHITTETRDTSAAEQTSEGAAEFVTPSIVTRDASANTSAAKQTTTLTPIESVNTSLNTSGASTSTSAAKETIGFAAELVTPLRATRHTSPDTSAAKQTTAQTPIELITPSTATRHTSPDTSAAKQTTTHTPIALVTPTRATRDKLANTSTSFNSPAPQATAISTDLNASFVATLRQKIRDLMQKDAAEQGNPTYLRMLGGLLRLAFHDCMGTACDGCINKQRKENAGLESYIVRVERFYAEERLQGIISRADLWALAGSEAVIYATELDACQTCSPFVPPLVFKWGRIDCPTSPWDSKSNIFPDPFGNTQKILFYFNQQYGFNALETVAILGAHVLGQAHKEASGFIHPWVVANDRFNNAFYQDILNDNIGWHMVNVGTQRNAKWQWEINEKLKPRAMMLNADVSLYKDLTDIQSDGLVRGCDYSTCANATDTAVYVERFAADNQGWIVEFCKAFTKMISLGYSSLRDVLP